LKSQDEGGQCETMLIFVKKHYKERFVQKLRQTDLKCHTNYYKRSFTNEIRRKLKLEKEEQK
jgi:hypothetical protein